MLLPNKIDDYIGENHPVRAIDAYVEGADMRALEFKHTEHGRTSAGQPPYNPVVLAKMYLYGYINSICSSRKLSKECLRNMEMIWLTQDSRPSHATIASFRRENSEALKKMNRDFVKLCRELDLFGAQQVAVDGTFIKADANKTTIRTKKFLDKELEEIEKKVEEYQQAVELADSCEGEQSSTEDEELAAKLEKIKEKQAEAQEMARELKRSGDTQISTVDKDARLMTKRGKTVAGYNAQITVDSKNKLVVGQELVQDGNDMKQLVPMVDIAKEALETEELEVLADAGYCNGTHLKECEESGVAAYVPVIDRGGKSKKKDRIGKDRFTYDSDSDSYRCPEGKELRARGKVKQNGKNYVRYRSLKADCDDCPLREMCLREKARTREVLRWEHEEVMERHVEKMKGAREKMRKRGSLVEHPFGTIKSRSGAYGFLVRGLEKCRGEFSLMVLGYNFTRVLKIVGVEGFIKHCARRTVKCGGTG